MSVNGIRSGAVMKLRSSRSSAFFICALTAFSASSPAQDSPLTKAAPQIAFPFSQEQRHDVTTGLAQKETGLRSALAAQPEEASLLYALALVLRQEGRANESLDTYTHAARLRKPTPQELRSVALDYVLLDDYDDAIHWLESAATMDPLDPNILYALGRCYYSKNRFVEAGSVYLRVLALRPRDLKAEENLGLTYEAANRSAEAESALRTAASWANPHGTDEWPFVNLGSFLFDHNRPEEAIEPLQIAIQIQPASVIAHEKLGRSFLATQQSTEGVEHLRKAVSLDPRNPRVHYELGRALRDAGQAEEAKKEFALSQQLYSAHSAE